MLNRSAAVAVRFVHRWIPDPFVIAVLLTLLTLGLARVLAGYSIADSVYAWGDGFWGLLRFTGQIILTFVLGHALANTVPVGRLLNHVASRVNTASGAYMMICFVSGIAALLSWGLCLVVAAILSRVTSANCAARGIRVHYPLLVASGYSGLVIWHQGISGSIPLIINTPGHFLEDKIGLVSVADTVFAPWNMVVALLILVTLPFVMKSLAPGDNETRVFEGEKAGSPDGDGAAAEISITDHGPAARLEQARWINGLVVVGGAAFLAMFFLSRRGSLNLDILNFAFLILGIALSKSPRNYLQLINGAAPVIGPFLLQYPFYAGIMAIMRDSGLAAIVVEFFVAMSSAQTLPVWSFFSAGLVNIFVPSGGGQWAVQGPVAVEAALALGNDIPKIAMAVAWGDQWTNMIQPLFAIPTLAIAGLHLRDIMGYCLITLIFTGIIFAGALLII